MIQSGKDKRNSSIILALMLVLLVPFTSTGSSVGSTVTSTANFVGSTITSSVGSLVSFVSFGGCSSDDWLNPLKLAECALKLLCSLDPFCDTAHQSWGPDGRTILQLTGNGYNYPASDNITDPPLASNVSFISDSFDRSCPLCMLPPFEVYNGRTGCLNQFRPPISPGVNMDWRVYCAEASRGSTFLNPRITVRMQACNLFVCFTMNQDLNPINGECVT
jgi:hypothetical protein